MMAVTYYNEQYFYPKRKEPPVDKCISLLNRIRNIIWNERNIKITKFVWKTPMPGKTGVYAFGDNGFIVASILPNGEVFSENIMEDGDIVPQSKLLFRIDWKDYMS